MSFRQLRQNNELPRARISTDHFCPLYCVNKSSRMTIWNYRSKTLVPKCFFSGKWVCHRFWGRKKKHFEIIRTCKICCYPRCLRFQQRSKFASEDKKTNPFFCVAINESNFQTQTTVFFLGNSPHSMYLLTLYIRLFLRLLNKKCGTFGQLQYYANNFDDFFVSIFIVFIAFHRNRMTFLFIHSLWRRANALGSVSRKSRKRFGPDKPSVKRRPAYSVKLVFSYAVTGIKIKITAKFSVSRRFRFADTKWIMSPEMRRKRFGTFETRAPGLSFSKHS